MKKYYLLVPVALLLLMVGCKEDIPDPTDVAFFVTPKASATIIVNGGEQQRYEMELHTTHDYISRICITSYNAIEGNRVQVDTVLTKSQEKFIFDYLAPYFNRDSVNVMLTFEAWDNTGSYGTSERTLTVNTTTRLLSEKSGIVLRASESGYADAFSFDNPSKTFNWKHSPDSIFADLYLLADSNFASLSFASNTDAKMVRINSFDYAAATALTLINIFESSRLSSTIDNLAVNDIILVGHNQKAQGVILVTNIVRSGNIDECSVHLSYKGIEETSNIIN